MNMRALVIGIAVGAVVSFSTAVAQVVDPAQSRPVQLRYEAGLYDEALQLVAERRQSEMAPPEDAYLSTQILLKIGQRDRAVEEAARLVEMSSEGPWRLIAASSAALIANNGVLALKLAQDSTLQYPDQFFAFYQLGLVAADRQDWNGAAAAFERATAIDPSFAYGHYYAGLSYSRIKRVDLTAAHFETFLKLAPQAPERAAVESIMRSLRGR